MINLFRASRILSKSIGLFSVLVAACSHAKATTPVYSIWMKPGEIRDLALYCIDQWGNPIPWASFTTAAGWVGNSNSHYHETPGRPTTLYQPDHGTTQGAGYEVIRFYTSGVGQDEYMEATCTKEGYIPRTTYNFYSVAYDDLFWTGEHGDVWDYVGATPGVHGSIHENHWMTEFAAYRIWWATQDYLSLFPDTPDHLIASNDQSLAFGGTFDIEKTWNPPHIFHYRGTAADIRGNASTHTVPVSRQQVFLFFCEQKISDLAQIEFANEGDDDFWVADNRRHIHCHWPITN